MSRVETDRASCLRLGVAVVTLAGLACVVLGPASGRQLKYGGTLIVGLSGGGGLSSSLDPTVSAGTNLNVIWHAMCEELFERDAKLEEAVEDQPSCTPIPPSNTIWFDTTTVPCTPYNPKDARKLVAASGIPNPTVHLLGAALTGQFIQAQEAAVGINVILDTADDATIAAWRTSGNFDTLLFGRSPGVADPNDMISPFFASSGAQNWGGYSNPRLDLILANGLKATSIQARSTLYHAAQQIIENDRPVIVLYNVTTIAAISTNVTGIEITPSGAVTLANARFK